MRHILYALKVHIKLVVDTSGWNTMLTGNTRKTLNAMIGGPKKEAEVWHKIIHEVTISGMYEES